MPDQKTPLPQNVKRFGNLRLNDLEDRDVSKDILIVSLGPVENHGRHLPTGTDVYISEEIARRTAGLYAKERPDAGILLYPTIPLGSAAIRGTGSVKVTSRQLKRSLIFLCGRFMKQGYRRFVFISAHGGVPHVGALDDVCRVLNGRGAKALAPAARVAINT